MLAGERRDVVPIGTELRALAWSGVMLIAAGVGIIIKKHFDQIGPLTIAVAIGAAAAFCYAWVALKKRAPLDDYVVLLGALLISADVGFIETQWKVFGNEWQRHFLLLAIAHAAAAYFFGSRAVLSLSIASLAAWLGIEQRKLFISSEVELAIRAFICTGILGVWREIDRRIHRGGFTSPFEHFGANIAFWGALILTADRDTRWLGLFLGLLFSSLSLYHGVRRQRELFVIYAVIYGLIAVDIVVVEQLHDEIVISAYLVLSTIVAIAALITVHLRYRQVPA